MTVLEWLVRLFNVCFMLSIVPVDWVIACMVPLYKGKGDFFFFFFYEWEHRMGTMCPFSSLHPLRKGKEV